jgi:hypothetical protein
MSINARDLEPRTMNATCQRRGAAVHVDETPMSRQGSVRWCDGDSWRNRCRGAPEKNLVAPRMRIARESRHSIVVQVQPLIFITIASARREARIDQYTHSRISISDSGISAKRRRHTESFRLRASRESLRGPLMS